MSEETRVQSESNALSLFDQLKNSVNHNIISLGHASASNKTTRLCTAGMKKLSSFTKKTATTKATTRDISIKGEWRCNIEDDSSNSSEKSIKSCLDPVFPVGDVGGGVSGDDCNDSTTSSLSSSLLSTSLSLTISPTAGRAGTTTTNPLDCSQKKSAACDKTEGSKKMKHLSATDTPTKSDSAIDYTLQAKNCHSSNANTTKVFPTTSSASSSSTAANLLASLTAEAAQKTAATLSLPPSAAAPALLSTTSLPSATTIVNMPGSKTNKLSINTQHDSAAASKPTIGVAPSAPHFPTPLPPPAPPSMSGGATTCGVSKNGSKSIGIGIVLGTKRGAASCSFGVTRAKQQHPQTHAFGLPHANFGNASGAAAAIIAHKKDNAFRSHQPLVGLNKKTSSTTSAVYRFTDGNIAGLESSGSNGKKKRCADRYDSSESSDSGVATSLSCTDSSTASSEDASEPGSPYSPQSSLGEDQQLQQLLTNKKKMAPQTILAAAANATNTATASNTSNILNTANTLNTANSNTNNTNKPKQPTHPQAVQKTLPLNTCNNTANSKLPSLQKISAQQSASTQPIWPWSVTPVTGAPAATPAAIPSKKRNSTSASDGMAKKSRASNGNALSATGAGLATANATQAANASKRLKAAVLEESQTKITGYFKSQMKAQQIQSKRPEIVSSSSGVSNGMTTNALTMSTPATTASLNKYFNILSQIKENNSQREQQQQQQQKTISTSNSPAAATTSSAANLTSSITITPTPSTTSSTVLPVPALKKIERSKPTKIAQVAPNLRKPYNSNNSNYGPAATVPGKSPKKHVAIAPRTPDMKHNQTGAKEIASKPQQILPQQQQPAVLLTAIRMPPAPAVPQHQQTTATHQQHALGAAQTATIKQQQTTTTAVKVPTAATTNNAAANTTLFQLPVQLPNLVQLPQLLAAANGANIMQLSSAAAKSTAQAAAATTAQAAQAAAAQYFLNGTVFKLQQFTTATTTTATSAVATASGPAATVNPFNFMQANDLQDLLLKQQQQMQQQHQQLQLQQKNTAATAANANNVTNFQEIFQQQVAAAVAASQQQQQQQQFQQLQRLSAAANNLPQPVFMATPAGLLLNAATLPTMLAQAAAAIAANNNQQHQQKTIALQQQQQTLPALQPIQAAMPALSSIYGQHAASSAPQSMEASLQELHHQQQQQQHQQQQQQQFQQQLALAQQQHQQHQQQFVTATQPPPLSVVSANSMANNGITPAPAAKLAIVKANSAQFSALSSQPPPLVTISSGSATAKPRAQVAAACSTQTKPSAVAKPYQKRAPKANIAPTVQTNAKSLGSNQTCKPKMVGAASKIVASPTTPPPLVPASKSGSNALLTPAHSMPAPTTQSAALTISQVKPTPALVSIAPSNPSHPAKLVTSISSGMSSTTCTSSLPSSNQLHQIKPTAAVVAKDLFDMVKNSAPPMTATPTISTTPIHIFNKIKEEPVDEPQELTTSTPSPIKPVTPTYAANLPADIKLELLEDVTKLSSSNPSAMQDCSSSSFCSHSNSISSSADLSLEASTAASLTSSAPSPAPSNESAAVEPSCACDSNSNSCATTTAASLATSQDQLNDLSIMSSSASSSSLSSVSNTCSLHLSLSASMNSKSKSKQTVDKRNLPTPESGLGGSLSNSESSNSLASNSSSRRLSCCKVLSSAELDIANSMSNTSTTESPPESISMESQIFATPFSESNTTTTAITPTTVDTQLAESSSAELPKAAISPILSQPKTIRFPAASGIRCGPKGAKRHDGVCYWHKCNKKHDSSSKLLDHMQTHHVNSQTGPFACLWVGCKVYNKESCSRRWLERHVLSHGGSKQFKCIVEGCGLRFGSQLALQKHVNNHFTATENKESTNKRTSDPPVPKQLRKNGKKLRYRRQPFSARMFDFFDAGIMEGLQHRLRQISTLTNGRNAITFQGQSMMRRRNIKGAFECFVSWSPKEIISDEWLPECAEPYVKTVKIKQMRPAEKTKVESLLMTAYRLPYAPNLFENDFALGISDSGRNTHKSDGEEESDRDENGVDHDDNEDDDDDMEDEDEEEDEDENDGNESATETETNECASTVSSYQQVLTIAKLQMQQQRKHPRKPQKRMPIAAAATVAQHQQ